MSRRNVTGMTGSNNMPLGPRRRFGEDDDNGVKESSSEHTLPGSHKRGRSPAKDDLKLEGPPVRRKINRWGTAEENKAAGLMALPTAVMSKLDPEQLDVYILNLRIEEISQKLKINDVVPAERAGSVSPPPVYDNMGRRTNTRNERYRKRLEDERHKLIEKAMKLIPNYHPPPDYRRPTKTQEKVYVPVNDYPELNFIGLLIGPRGNTLKKMETDSGAKIAIRGKGSVKEGKGRSDAAHTSNQEEELHCLIMADSEEKVNKAKKLVNQVIETAASIPEGQNALKRKQLRDLATLNGTLRDDENQACQNCGQIGHRRYDCPEHRNFTANIICRICGNAGHVGRDCGDRAKGTEWGNGAMHSRPTAGRANDSDDREYESLMQEVNDRGSSHRPQGQIEAGSALEIGPATTSATLPPWQRGATGAPAPWARPRETNHDSRPAENAQYSNSWAPGSGSYGRQSEQSIRPTGAPAPWHQAPIAQQSVPFQPSGNSQAYGHGDYSSYPAGYGIPQAIQHYQPDHSMAPPQPPPPPPGETPPPPPSGVPPPPPPGM